MGDKKRKRKYISKGNPQGLEFVKRECLMCEKGRVMPKNMRICDQCKNGDTAWKSVTEYGCWIVKSA